MRAKGEVRELFAQILNGAIYSDYAEDAQIAAAKALGVIARGQLADREFAIDILFDAVSNPDHDIELSIACIQVLAGLWDLIPDSDSVID